MALGCQNIQDTLHRGRCLQKRARDHQWHECKALTAGESRRGGGCEKASCDLFLSHSPMHRVGAKLVPEIYENVTDPKQYEILEMSRISGFVDRARGTGRPTKKDRRQMDAFVEPAMYGFDDDFDE